MVGGRIPSHQTSSKDQVKPTRQPDTLTPMAKTTSSKDSVTGLSKPVSGFGNLEEDTIYSNLGGWKEVEGELSDKFFVITRRNPGETRRDVYEGKFKYDSDGVMTKATIKSIYFFNIYDESGEQIIVARQAKPHRKDKKIKNVANEYDWSSFDSNSKEVNYFVSEGGKTIDGSITPFTRFADGIFFSDDWWSNPFGQDLI